MWVQRVTEDSHNTVKGPQGPCCCHKTERDLIPLASLLQNEGSRHTPPHLASYVGAGESNQDLYAYSVGMLPTEPSSQAE